MYVYRNKKPMCTTRTRTDKSFESFENDELESNCLSRIFLFPAINLDSFFTQKYVELQDRKKKIPLSCPEILGNYHYLSHIFAFNLTMIGWGDAIKLLQNWSNHRFFRKLITVFQNFTANNTSPLT